jgi:hypothetical protein
LRDDLSPDGIGYRHHTPDIVRAGLNTQNVVAFPSLSHKQ